MYNVQDAYFVNYLMQFVIDMPGKDIIIIHC